MSAKEIDSILAFLVEATNKHRFSLDITLNVNGSIVSGTTVSAKGYFEGLSDAFEDGNDISKKISEQLSQASEAVEDRGNEMAQFIHLKNAKVYCGDSKPTPSSGKILWRGKLQEIDGFFLGKISEARSSTSSKTKS